MLKLALAAAAIVAAVGATSATGTYQTTADGVRYSCAVSVINGLTEWCNPA
jgi:hypothetical protein